jgi:hypothetical protein
MRPNYKRPARFERERAKSGRRQREIHHSQSMHGRHICRSIHSIYALMFMVVVAASSSMDPTHICKLQEPRPREAGWLVLWSGRSTKSSPSWQPHRPITPMHFIWRRTTAAPENYSDILAGDLNLILILILILMAAKCRLTVM